MIHETMEAVRNFRDNTTWDTDGLGTLTAGTDYYPEIVTVGTTTKWTMTAGTESIGDFTRKVVFDDVSRDTISYDIESTYNVLNDDPDTKKVTATLSWGNRSVEIISYLTNWR